MRVLAAALDEKLARFEVLVLYRKLGRALKLIRPFAGRVAYHGDSWFQLGQAEFFPERLGSPLFFERSNL